MSRSAWQTILKGRGPKAVSRMVLAGAFALALGASANVRPAQAHSNWVGPAIAGFVIGSIFANELSRQHYKTYRYGYPAYHPYRHPKRVKYHRPRYVTPYYPPAVVVPVPIPVPFLVVPGYW